MRHKFAKYNKVGLGQQGFKRVIAIVGHQAKGKQDGKGDCKLSNHCLHFDSVERRACAAAALLPGAPDCPVLAAVRTRPLLAQLTPHRQARTFRCNTLRSTRTQRHTIKETNSLSTILAALDPGHATLDRDVPLLVSGANVGPVRPLLSYSVPPNGLVLAAVRTRPLLAQLDPHRQARTFRCDTLRSTRTQRHTTKRNQLALDDPCRFGPRPCHFGS